MKTNRNMLTVVMVMAAIALTAGSAKAALIKITGVSASASSQEGASRSAQHTVNESGFNPATHTVTETNPNNTLWNTSNGVTKAATWIRFDMGAEEDIAEMWVFNYNDPFRNAENRRFITADIWYSNTGATANPTDATPGDWTKLTNDQSFTEAPYTTSYSTPDKLTLNLDDTRHVLMNDIVNNGATQWGNGYGLSEVEFFTTGGGPPAPPPSGGVIVYNFDDANAVVDVNEVSSLGISASVWEVGGNAGLQFLNGRVETHIRRDAPQFNEFSVTIPDGVVVDLTQLDFEFGWDEAFHPNTVTPQWLLTVLPTGTGTPNSGALPTITAGGLFGQDESVWLDGLTGLTNTTVTFQFELSDLPAENREHPNRRFTFDDVTLTLEVPGADVIPEPATLSLLGLGALLALRRRRRRK